jgi:hypothetical protein
MLDKDTLIGRVKAWLGQGNATLCGITPGVFRMQVTLAADEV